MRKNVVLSDSVRTSCKYPIIFRAIPRDKMNSRVVFYRMANFDIRQNSNIRYRRIATILPEYQLFHQNTQFPTRIHNSLPEYQNKLPEYQNKMDSFTILRLTVIYLHFALDTSKWSQLSDVDLVPIFEALVTAVICFKSSQYFVPHCGACSVPHGVQCTPHWNLCPTISLIKWGINVKSIMKIHDHSHLHNFSTSGCSPSRNIQIQIAEF